jgi:hypothetical protein
MEALRFFAISVILWQSLACACIYYRLTLKMVAVLSSESPCHSHQTVTVRHCTRRFDAICLHFRPLMSTLQFLCCLNTVSSRTT